MFFKKLYIGFIVFPLFFNLSVFDLFTHKRPELEVRYVKVKKGDTYWRLFKDKGEIVSRINKIDIWHLMPGTRLKVPLDWELAKGYPFFPKFLWREKETPKLILVVIQEQFLAGYEYGWLKFSYPVCSGMEKGLTPDWVLKRQAEIEKWQKERMEKERISELAESKEEVLAEHPTPRGRFKILYKGANHRSSIYPKPDGGQFMPWTAIFSWEGYGFHAWGFPNDLKESIKKALRIYFKALAPAIIEEFEKYAMGKMPGWPDSHGCIRLFYEDAHSLFEWVEAKKTIVLIIDSFENFPPAAEK